MFAREFLHLLGVNARGKIIGGSEGQPSGEILSLGDDLSALDRRLQRAKITLVADGEKSGRLIYAVLLCFAGTEFVHLE